MTLQLHALFLLQLQITVVILQRFERIEDSSPLLFMVSSAAPDSALVRSDEVEGLLADRLRSVFVDVSFDLCVLESLLQKADERSWGDGGGADGSLSDEGVSARNTTTHQGE